MKKLTIKKSAASEASPDFHKMPEHAPPRFDLRKPRILNDSDITDVDNDADLDRGVNGDPDLSLS